MEKSSQNQYQDLKTFRLPPHFRGRSEPVTLLWWFVQKSLFAWSPMILFGWRNFLLRLFGAHIGRRVQIRPSVEIIYPWRLVIGDDCWIGDDVLLYSLATITIEHDTVISQRSNLCTGGHDYQSTTFDTTVGEIQIGSEVWIATDVFISPGTQIGDGAVIGARSSVFSDMPGGMICYGNPAKPHKKRVSRQV